MTEEPGVSSCEICPTISWGISIRSRAALASSGGGSCSGRSQLFLALLHLAFYSSLVALSENVLGIDTAFQRNEAPSSCDFNRVNTWVPKGSSGFSILIGASNNGVKR